jgi:heme exporter protein C
MKRLAVPIFAVLGAVGFVGTLWLAFVVVPPDRALHFNQKIFYWHVAHALTMFLAVGVAGVSSIAFLRRRNPRWDDVALAAAEVAALFGAVVLATGMIWAKAAWGVWWSWENRLTMSLLEWLTLVGYVLVRRFAGTSGERLAAGLAVFAMIGVPFIYTMVKADDRHPQAGPQGNVMTLEGDMKIAFWLSLLTFLCWFIALTIGRVQSARGEREVRELRERGLDAGVLT